MDSKSQRRLNLGQYRVDQVPVVFTINLSAMAPVSTIDAILSNLRLPSRTFPFTFTESSTTDPRGIRVGLPTSKPLKPPNVTAIVLNWSRLDNVIRIASLLCGPWLDDTIAEVYVWNNSPRKLSKEVGQTNFLPLMHERRPDAVLRFSPALTVIRGSSR